MSEHPATMAHYIASDDTNTFEPVKLDGAIRSPDNFDDSTYLEQQLHGGYMPFGAIVNRDVMHQLTIQQLLKTIVTNGSA